MKSATLQRAYSVKSRAALTTLGGIFDSIDEIDVQLSELEAFSRKPGVEQVELFAIKTKTAILSGEVEKLQAKRVDSVETATLQSGKDDARSSRKRANQYCEELLERIHALHKDCLSRAGQAAFIDATSPRRSVAAPASLARPQSLQQHAHSEASVRALSTLEQVHVAVDEAEDDFLELSLRYSAAQKQVVQTGDALMALARKLDAIQTTRLDAVVSGELTSGKAEATQQRKALGQKIAGLKAEIEAVIL